MGFGALAEGAEFARTGFVNLEAESGRTSVAPYSAKICKEGAALAGSMKREISDYLALVSKAQVAHARKAPPSGLDHYQSEIDKLSNEIRAVP